MGRFTKFLVDDFSNEVVELTKPTPANNRAERETLITEVKPSKELSGIQDEAEDDMPSSEELRKAAQKAWLETKVRIHARLIEDIDLAALDGLDTPSLREQVLNIVREIVLDEKLKLTIPEIKQLADGIFDEMTGLGPLEPLLQDDSVSDILINTHEQVYVERGGELELSGIQFANEPHLLRIINRIVATVGRRVDESQPLWYAA